MTPAQQSALETLVGRSLTADEVASLSTWVPQRRDDLITDLLNTGRVKYAEKRLVEIAVVGAYPGGPVAADALLAKLEAHAAASAPLSRLVGRALKAMAVEPGLNLGDPATHTMLDALVSASVITAEESAALKFVALVPDPLSRESVSRALNKVTA